MAEYVCTACRKVIELELATAKKIQCPFCGYRILEKRRAPVVKRVEAE
ncbi:MAG: DNA-directed RNA polymerase subunit P [Candidatus Aenigmatarchaeota archaeon]|nr:MAG: DNA-directed RNA polymerase subunit P [Candidatus Aenigmarchaeota archaeon]